MEFLLVASIGAIACGFFQIAHPEHPNNINQILIYVGIIGLVVWLLLTILTGLDGKQFDGCYE